MSNKENITVIKGPRGIEVGFHDGSAIEGSRKEYTPEWDWDTVRLFTQTHKFNRLPNGKLTRKLTKSFNCMHDE